MNDPTIPTDRAQSCGQVQGQAAKGPSHMGWRGVLKKASLRPDYSTRVTGFGNKPNFKMNVSKMGVIKAACSSCGHGRLE